MSNIPGKVGRSYTLDANGMNVPAAAPTISLSSTFHHANGNVDPTITAVTKPKETSTTTSVGGGKKAITVPTPPVVTHQNTAGAYSSSSATDPTKQTADISSGQGYNTNSPGGGADGSDAPMTEDDVYRRMLKQSQGIIDQIQQGYDAQIAATKADDAKTGAEAESNQNAMAAASGLLGSSASLAGIEKTRQDTNTKTASDAAPLVQARAQAVAGVLDKLQTNAQNEYQFERQQTDTEKKDAIAQAQDHIKTLSEAGVNWDSFKNTPQYASLISSLGGDSNYADALFTMNKPQGVVDPNLSKVIGNTYYQVTKDPVTGKISSSSFELPYDVPKNWTFQKVGTNAAIVYDPNNYNPSDPSTFKNVYIDPFTGQVTDGTSSPTDSAGSGDGSAARNVQTLLPAQADGTPADMSQPLSQAVATYGPSTIASAIIKNEGRSPTGVNNNPGNIKFTGAPGQKDSGVKASDGGTFASYDSPETGQKAVEDLVTNAANGKSDAYGAAPTLAGFIGKYTNTGSGKPAVDSAQYGLLASVEDFDPANQIDSAASNYLNEYLYQGKTPSAASVGVSTRTGSGAVFNQIAQRANELYTKATGQALPDITRLAADKKIITANNLLQNKLKVQEDTVNSNFGLSLENLDANNINQGIPAVNAVMNALNYAEGDPDVAAYLAQNTTLQNEAASLIAVKNASGTTVYDKMEAAGLVPENASSEQQQAILKKLILEAKNASNAIAMANAQVYNRIDPLRKDPSNPLSNPQSFISSLGYDINSIRKDNPGVSDQDILSQLLQQ